MFVAGQPLLFFSIHSLAFTGGTPTGLLFIELCLALLAIAVLVLDSRIEDRHAISISIFFGVLTMVMIVGEIPWKIHHDCAMYVRIGQLLLDGKVPYVDFVDLNPPLIFYISMIPALLSRWLSIDPILAFFSSVFLSCIWAWIASYVVLKNSEVDQNTKSGLLIGLMLINLICAIWGEFGQREHLFCIAFFPFMLVRWRRRNHAKLNSIIVMGIGIFAGIALALKPQYLIVPGLLEAFWLIKSRCWRPLIAPELIALLASMFIYAAAIMVAPAESKYQFLHRWLPLILQGYSAYNSNFLVAFTMPLIMGITPLFLILFFFIPKEELRRPSNSVVCPLIISVIGGYLAFVLQMKFWFNHAVPMLLGLVPLAVVLFGTRRVSSSRTIDLVKACACVCMVLLPWVAVRTNFSYQDLGEDRALISKETQPGDPVMILSGSLPDAYPSLLTLNRQMASRYFFLFPLVIFEHMRITARSGPEIETINFKEQMVVAELREDLNKYKPKLVLIQDDGSNNTGSGWLFECLCKYGFASELCCNYEQYGFCKGQWNKMRVWKRIDKTSKLCAR